MALAEAIEHEMGRSTMPPAKSIVFVVDDDISVRESLELLIHSGRLAPGAVRFGASVPRPSTGFCPALSRAGHFPPGTKRSRSAEACHRGTT